MWTGHNGITKHLDGNRPNVDLPPFSVPSYSACRGIDNGRQQCPHRCYLENFGHENRRTTELYLHSIGDMERQAIWAYGQAREKSHTGSHMGPINKKGPDRDRSNPSINWQFLVELRGIEPLTS